LIPTFSPQGDGNDPAEEGSLQEQEGELIPTFSPQGDGNIDLLSTKHHSGAVDPYLFPARGRKLRW